MLIADKLPATVFDEIQLGAGVILSDFSTSDWTVNTSKILAATSGGINFADTPTYTDFGEDIDNCPKNSKELKKLESREVKMSGTYVSVTPAQVKGLAGAADLDSSSKKITPREELQKSDFQNLWFVCDYGDNSAIAIHLNNALSTSGFQIQTTNKSKGQFSFEYTAHYSIEDSTAPYEIFFK